MGLTLAQRFGSNATIDETTSNDPKLVISLNDLKNTADGGDITNTQGLNLTITASNASANSDRIFAALFVLNKQKQPTENTVDTLGVFIQEPLKSFVTRDVITQIELSYPVSIYVPDPTANLDPDNVVTA